MLVIKPKPRSIASLFLIVVSLALLTLSACRNGYKRIKGNGVISAQQRDIAPFEDIRVDGPFHVHLAQGARHAVSVSAEENLQQYIDTRLEGNLLVISSRSHVRLRPKKEISITVTSPRYSNINIRGSGEINTTSALKSERFNLEIMGSGDIQLQLDAPVIDAAIKGSGNITLSGRTARFDADISGSGDIKAFDLMSEHTKVRIAGAGDAQVFASKTLSIHISGAGDVAYKGTASVQQSVNGAGNIHKAD